MRLVNIDQRFGERVREERTSLGLSQKKLADLMGVSQNQVSRYETSEGVTLGSIRNLCDFLPGLAVIDSGKLSDEELRMLNLYSKLTPEYRKTVERMIRDYVRLSELESE